MVGSVLRATWWVVFLVLAFCPWGAWAKETPRPLPVPDTVSRELAPYVTEKPLSPVWNAHPRTPQEWKALAARVDALDRPGMEALKRSLRVQVQAGRLGGVDVYTLTPSTVAPAHADHVLVHLHGGGYVFNGGETGISEGLLLAARAKCRVVSVDYRMPPEHPYPAALDDVVAVYRSLLTTYPATHIGVFGSSTGGALTLALGLRAKAEGLPQPAALAPGSPWSDMTLRGDTYVTHEGQDNILVSYHGWLGDAAKLYAAGHDLRDPYLSPVYGDVSGFPPCLLTAGTRDLFLSNTVRMHLRLRTANVAADLLVFEGMSHVMYYLFPHTPESQWYFTELTRFFDRYLGGGRPSQVRP